MSPAGVQLRRPRLRLRTDVRILRGQHRGREGWISGTLEDRSLRGITKALVKFDDGTLPELMATSSLEAAAQLGLFASLQTQKDPPQARRPAAGRMIS